MWLEFELDCTAPLRSEAAFGEDDTRKIVELIVDGTVEHELRADKWKR
jgi:hypothetical protein